MTTHQAIRKYKQGQVLGLRPEALLAMMYGEALKACRRKDADGAALVIQTLRQSLQTDANRELAFKLNVLYNSCLALISQQRFDETSSVLGIIYEALQQTGGN